MIGLLERFFEGDVDGDSLGLFVGDVDGETRGLCEGDVDGDLLGFLDGDADGDLLGLVDGEFGERVGDLVGLLLGAVATSADSTHTFMSTAVAAAVLKSSLLATPVITSETPGDSEEISYVTFNV